jgi:uncharacterized membrane protein
MSEQSEKALGEEIKKELQLERMILFSDAVFAIVITLMAIELRLPEGEHAVTEKEWWHETFKHLFPVFTAYVVSFFFIGQIWYRHLKLFSYLKDYNVGLIIRNFVLLFFVGLFPFGASLATSPRKFFTPYVLYLSIIILCMGAQYLLQHYVLVKHPELRNDKPVDEDVLKLKASRFILITLFLVMILVVVTFMALQGSDGRFYAFFWTLLVPIVVRVTRAKYKKDHDKLKLR